jgi:hypothetical protein
MSIPPRLQHRNRKQDPEPTPAIKAVLATVEEAVRKARTKHPKPTCEFSERYAGYFINAVLDKIPITELSRAEKELIAKIDGFMKGRKICWASDKQLAAMLQVSLGGLKNMLIKLQANDKYIVRIGMQLEHYKRVINPKYSNNPALSQKLIDEYPGKVRKR